jgi:integrase
VLAQWHTDKLREAQCKPETIEHQLRRMRAFFAPVAEQDIATLTPKRAAALYAEATQRISAKTGCIPAVASQRYDLWAAQCFFRWAVRRGYVGSTPFRDVKPVGKVNTGKPQLRIEEARRFTEAAIRYFEETQRPLAIGALVALTMGLRTSEVLDRVVRDLDDGARYLWIDAGKTANARRHLEVPEPVQPYLLHLAAGKRPEELLFGATEGGGRRYSQRMWEMVRRLCRRAGVPLICTHSLRGLWATLAVQSGAASHVVAANLGHHSFQVTERHYAQGAAVKNAATARVLGMLAKGCGSKRPSAKEQLEQLDENTLAQLLALLAESKKGGTPAN